MVRHAGIYIDYRSYSNELLIEAISSVDAGGKLDLVISPTPESLTEAKDAVCLLYSKAPPRVSELDFTVMFEDNQKNLWQRTFGTRIGISPESLQIYNCVAVGGTWDHLHWGHRLMLTMAAVSAKHRAVVGVTGPELLVKKKFASALDSYDVRVDASVKFILRLRPGLRVDPFPLHDMYGPTLTVEDITALVVSKETSAGGGQINEKRFEKGWPGLDIVEVGLIGGTSGTDKLSSTDLRREQSEREKERL